MMEKAIVFFLLAVVGGSLVNSVPDVKVIQQKKLTLRTSPSLPFFRFDEIRTDVQALVSTIVITMKPGDEGLGPHHHPGPVAGYVAEGEFLFQMKGGEIEILSAGQAFYEKDGDIHMWGASASKTATTKVIATLFGREAEELTIMDPNEPREDSYEVALRKARRRT